MNLLNDTAWLLATNPNASIRNGPEAVRIAERALRLSRGNEPAVVGTLAAAYAEAGRYADAVETARRAIALSERQGDRALADTIRARLRLYESGSPYRGAP